MITLDLDYDLLADKIAERLRPREAVAVEQPEVWKVQDIAKFLRVSQTTAYKIIEQQGFPASKRIANSGNRFWLRDDVIKWANANE